MNKKISGTLKKSFKVLIKKPLIIMPALVLFIFLFFFSKLSVKVNYLLTNNTSLVIWLIIFSVSSLLIGSYLITWFILICNSTIRVNPLSLLKKANKFWLKNFLIILITLFVYNLIRFLSHYLTLFIGRSFDLPLNLAVLVFYILFFAGLVGILIFISFSIIILPIYNKSIINSIKSSIFFVKKNYLSVLSLTVLFFALYQIVQFIPNLFIIDIISTIIIFPYFITTWVYFLISNFKIK